MRRLSTVTALAFLLGIAGPQPAPLAAQGEPAAVRDVTWATVPAGSFRMGCSADDNRCDGDEYPTRTVTISRPFEMMTTEVTVGMLFAANEPLQDQPEWSTSFDQPVVIVSWDEARLHCDALGGRLPTEAEWEYAARGGIEGAVFPWGSETPSYDDGDRTGAAFEGGGARPVATFGPNGYGLYDMAGNVWEWVADVYAGYPGEAETDPVGPADGLVRTVRGGSYGDDSGYLRVANRNPAQPDGVHVNVGFRCARDLGR